MTLNNHTYSIWYDSRTQNTASNLISTSKTSTFEIWFVRLALTNKLIFFDGIEIEFGSRILSTKKQIIHVICGVVMAVSFACVVVLIRDVMAATVDYHHHQYKIVTSTCMYLRQEWSEHVYTNIRMFNDALNRKRILGYSYTLSTHIRPIKRNVPFKFHKRSIGRLCVMCDPLPVPQWQDFTCSVYTSYTHIHMTHTLTNKMK